MTKPRPYAERTKVPVERSRMQIERLLIEHGATGFVSGWDDETSSNLVMFRLEGRMVRFNIREPHWREFEQTPKGQHRAPGAARKACEGERRRRWRALYILVRAKLVAIAEGDSTVDREFLPDILLPDKRTVGELITDQIEQSYLDGKMPPLLPGRSAAR